MQGRRGGVIRNCRASRGVSPCFIPEPFLSRERLAGYRRSFEFCTTEDLLIMKMIAGRERDLLDSKDLLRLPAGRTLDFADLENGLGPFAEALEYPGLRERIQVFRKAPCVQSLRFGNFSDADPQKTVSQMALRRPARHLA